MKEFFGNKLDHRKDKFYIIGLIASFVFLYFANSYENKVLALFIFIYTFVIVFFEIKYRLSILTGITLLSLSAVLNLLKFNSLVVIFGNIAYLVVFVGAVQSFFSKNDE